MKQLLMTLALAAVLFAPTACTNVPANVIPQAVRSGQDALPGPFGGSVSRQPQDAGIPGSFGGSVVRKPQAAHRAVQDIAGGGPIQ